jgi:hypothetical protein
MSRSKKKPNSLNRTGIQRIKEQIVTAWPWANVVKALYIEDPTPLGVSDTAAFREVAVGASAEIRGDKVNLRIFRKPEADDEHDYDVDEIRDATGPVLTIASKSWIDGHHLTGAIADDLMRRNNLTAVVVPDGEGGMQLSAQPDGRKNVFINFEHDLDPDKDRGAENRRSLRGVSARSRRSRRHARFDRRSD